MFLGLYGMSYIESCESVFQLFKSKGWDAVISDDLIDNLFFMMEFMISGICAAIGYGMSQSSGVSHLESISWTLGLGGFVLGISKFN